MPSPLFDFTFALNSVPFWNLLVCEFLLGISKTILRSMSTLIVKIVLLLDDLQQLMLTVGKFTYFET
jgi:hypothetical protein